MSLIGGPAHISSDHQRKTRSSKPAYSAYTMDHSSNGIRNKHACPSKSPPLLGSNIDQVQHKKSKRSVSESSILSEPNLSDEDGQVQQWYSEVLAQTALHNSFHLKIDLPLESISTIAHELVVASKNEPLGYYGAELKITVNDSLVIKDIKLFHDAVTTHSLQIDFAFVEAAEQLAELAAQQAKDRQEAKENNGSAPHDSPTQGGTRHFNGTSPRQQLSPGSAPKYSLASFNASSKKSSSAGFFKLFKSIFKTNEDLMLSNPSINLKVRKFVHAASVNSAPATQQASNKSSSRNTPEPEPS